MTDEEAMDHALSTVEAAGRDQSSLKRNGRLFMTLPARRLAALHTLRLYQPQRSKARWFTFLMQFVVLSGLYRHVSPRFRGAGGMMEMKPAMPPCLPGTAGVMLGSPEHRVRRAIASYKTSNGWEVAKIAFGVDGWNVIRGEVEALNSLPERTLGAPTLLGLHRGDGISLMRMPYFQGTVLSPGESTDAIALLESWKSDMPMKLISKFPEWPAIESALSSYEQGPNILQKLSQKELRPVIRHGDFARWNLLRLTSGDLMVLDWEWGISSGLPGIDLVHFFAQDARLVQQLPPAEVVRSVEQSLDRPDCRQYLEKTGWDGEINLAILASIAFTVGAKQQANEEVLGAALAIASQAQAR